MALTAPRNFDESLNDIRIKIKEIAKTVLAVKGTAFEFPENAGEDRAEVMANLMLSYRHLEDASMRIGKVMQQRSGGESIYDKNVVGSK